MKTLTEPINLQPGYVRLEPGYARLPIVLPPFMYKNKDALWSSGPCSGASVIVIIIIKNIQESF